MAVTLQQMKVQFTDAKRAGIVDLLWQNSRLMRELHFIDDCGLAYPYTQRAKLPGVGFRSLNEVFTPTAGVMNPAVETLSIFGGRIRTDSVQITIKGQRARTNEVSGQIEAAAKFFDKQFINGDPAFSGGKGFLGLRGRLFGTQRLTIAPNGDVVNHKAVLRALDQVEGDNSAKVIVCNRTVRRDLSNEVGGGAGGRNVFDVGKQLTTFEGARIVEVFKDEAEQDILPFTETCGTSTNCTSLYVVAFGGATDERGVQGLSGLPGRIQAKGPYDYGEYTIDVVQMLAGIGLFGGYVAARLEGIRAFGT